MGFYYLDAESLGDRSQAEMDLNKQLYVMLMMMMILFRMNDET